MTLHETCTTDQAAPQFDHEWQRRAFGPALGSLGVPPLRLKRLPAEPYRDDRSMGGRARGRTRCLGVLHHWVAALEKVIHDRSAQDRPGLRSRQRQAR